MEYVTDIENLMMETLAKILGWIVVIGVFVGWMSLVGSPHVNETAMGLVIAVILGLAVYAKVSGKKF